MATTTHIDGSLRALLTANAGIALSCGSRIFSTMAPQASALPCIVFVRQTGSREQFATLTGMTGFVRATFVLSCLAESLAEVRNLTRLVREAIQYTVTDAIRLAIVTTDEDSQEPPANGEQLPIYRTDLTVDIIHKE